MSHSAKYRIIHFANKEIKLCVTTWRKSCEHFMFVGAMGDMMDFVFHYEAWALLLAGKVAFVVGGLGVYLMHYEEVIPESMSHIT